MTDQWWTGHTAVETTVDCSGDQHRLRWHQGRLEALDHDDPDGERILAALGGTSCACIDLLDAWYRHADDLRLLTLASRGPGDALTKAQRAAAPGAVFGPQGRLVARPGVTPVAGWAGYSPQQINVLHARPGPAPAPGRGGYVPLQSTAAGPVPNGDDLSLLLSMDSALWDRLIATIIAEWAQRTAVGDQRCPAATPALAASLTGRVVLAIRQWLGDPNTQIRVEMVAPDDTPTLQQHDGQLVARLPFHWLRDLWMPGLTVLLDRFCLALVESGAHRQRILTIDKDLADPRIATITIDSEP